MSVVVGYVPTPEGEAALEAAVAEARTRGRQLVVVNTSRGDAPVDPKLLLPEDVPVLEERLAATGVDWRLQSLPRGRDAAEELLAAADAHRAELLVLGLRRRSPVGKLLLGSTAQRVLLDAPCAVLAVKAG